MSFQNAKIIREIISMRAKNCPKGEICLNEQKIPPRQVNHV